jgi:hypothetical protein
MPPNLNKCAAATRGAFSSSSNNDTHITSISLVDDDYVSHCPSIEEVIAFGGIQKPTIGVRSRYPVGWPA